MTLTLNLKPELETKVKHEAAKRGLVVSYCQKWCLS